MEIIDKAPLIRQEKVNSIISSKAISVQVAGTNGKGSTCAFLSAILRAHGKRVGLYISPHVSDICERISIDGNKISHDCFEKLVRELDKQQSGMCKSDLMFFVAVKYFNDNEVDFAVYETGMGGRNDSATLIDHGYGIITQIGLDHTEYLGNTIEKITEEKAGIIKVGMRIYAYPNETNYIIKEVCKKKKAELTDITKRGFKAKSDSFSFSGFGLTINDVKLSVNGEFQKYNCICALLCARDMLGYEFDLKKAVKAVEEVLVYGRISVLKESPMVIADVSHNPDGIMELCRYVTGIEGKKCAIVSIVKTKDFATMMELLNREFDIVIAACAEEGARNPAELGADLCIPDLKQAYTKAIEMNMDVIVFCGSFAIVRKAASIVG